MVHFKISINLLIGFIAALTFASPSYSQNRVVLESKSSCCSSGKKACLHNSSLTSLCQKACAVQDYDPGDLVSPASASIGDLTRCPVSGVVFKVTESSPVVEFEDQEVYTCCSSCQLIYNQDPEKFSVKAITPKT